MIFAELKDIKKYNIPEKVCSFLSTLTAETPVGHYEICDGIFANIDEYNTKAPINCDLEAHRKYIDVQLLLAGEEQIDFCNINELVIKIPYGEARDVMFFQLREKVNSLYLKPGNFALFYPEDAHRPQMAVSSECRKVKKVVVKILLSALIST